MAGPLRGIPLLLLLGAVAAACLLAVAHAGGVEGAADDLVPDAGEVLDPSPTHQDDRVLLQVVPDAGNVGGDLDPRRQPDPGDLAEGRVRLLGRRGLHLGAHPASLRASPEGRGLRLRDLALPALAEELLNRRQPTSLSLALFPVHSRVCPRPNRCLSIPGGWATGCTSAGSRDGDRGASDQRSTNIIPGQHSQAGLEPSSTNLLCVKTVHNYPSAHKEHPVGV